MFIRMNLSGPNHGNNQKSGASCHCTTIQTICVISHHLHYSCNPALNFVAVFEWAFVHTYVVHIEVKI